MTRCSDRSLLGEAAVAASGWFARQLLPRVAPLEPRLSTD
jgi:hypothetical protein